MKAKIRFYYSMASLIDAGLPITKALRQHLPSSFQDLAKSLANDIEAGKGQLNELMQNYPEVFIDFECRIVKIGEETGSLDRSFKILADFYQERQALGSNLIAGLVYPAFVYHFAAVLIPFISFIMEECSLLGTIIRIALALGIPYALGLTFFTYKCLESQRKIKAPMSLSSFCLNIPLLGILIRKLNYARFFHVFSITISAGINMVDGVILAAGSCGNAWIRCSFLKTAEEIKIENMPFSEALRHQIHPKDNESIAVQIMENGELSGKNDESAAKIAEIYRNESQSAMKLIVSIVPKAVYICMAIYIGWVIISFWSKIFSKTTSL